MAESDGLRQAYGIPAIAGTRPGYVFAKYRQQKRQDRKKKEPADEFRINDNEPGEEEKKGIDIKV
jgi:hypothetical protein